jgi:hypothetical protein
MLCYQRISRKNQECSELCLPQIYCHSLPWNIYSKTTRRKECLAAPKVMPSDSPGRISTRFLCRTFMILWNHWNQSIAFRDVQSKNATNALCSTLIMSKISLLNIRKCLDAFYRYSSLNESFLHSTSVHGYPSLHQDILIPQTTLIIQAEIAEWSEMIRMRKWNRWKMVKKNSIPCAFQTKWGNEGWSMELWPLSHRENVLQGQSTSAALPAILGSQCHANTSEYSWAC